MTTIRMPTVGLVGVLTDLVLTADDPANGDVTASVLLYTTRGHVGSEPGLTDLLVGTSTNDALIGHCWVACSGQLAAPTLWHVSDVRAVLAVLKPLTKIKEHVTSIKVGSESVDISEDLGTLFGDGMTLSFQPTDAADWPFEKVAAELSVTNVNRAAAIPRTTRTTFVAKRLAPFTKVSSRRGENIEMYRWHQRVPVQVQIGGAYRGVIATLHDDEDGRGNAPWGDVHPPQRPAEVGAA